ncbi:hypothetical protein NDU88_007764 [Pleurodeles waltl]|uniref:Uncharacterized protein n=1 Tax=Pleurodeles waltl TaxID=8319 RepID=A0AAV7RW12_PLEWA|nr:hypothetical protein NDU88_007764 [Pleurodeles waltl]
MVCGGNRGEEYMIRHLEAKMSRWRSTHHGLCLPIAPDCFRGPALRSYSSHWYADSRRFSVRHTVPPCLAPCTSSSHVNLTQLCTFPTPQLFLAGSPGARRGDSAYSEGCSPLTRDLNIGSGSGLTSYFMPHAHQSPLAVSTCSQGPYSVAE